MKIIIETILHQDQRYNTCGDWYYEPDGTLRIKVSNFEDKRLSKLVAIHELVEVLTCELNGVTQQQVDDFDKMYEANRAVGDESEPGDDSDAPYRKEHCLATGIERILAVEWGVDWNDYETQLGELGDVEPK